MKICSKCELNPTQYDEELCILCNPLPYKKKRDAEARQKLLEKRDAEAR